LKTLKQVCSHYGTRNIRGLADLKCNKHYLFSGKVSYCNTVTGLSYFIWNADYKKNPALNPALPVVQHSRQVPGNAQFDLAPGKHGIIFSN
jgi:hypothetical protein